MKMRQNEIVNAMCASAESVNLNNEQLEQQLVQQRYHSELEKYQEQISRTERVDSQDGQAA